MKKYVLVFLPLLLSVHWIMAQQSGLRMADLREINYGIVKIIEDLEVYSGLSAGVDEENFRNLFSSSETMVYCDIRFDNRYDEIVRLNDYIGIVRSNCNDLGATINNVSIGLPYLKNGKLLVDTKVDKRITGSDKCERFFEDEHELIITFEVTKSDKGNLVPGINSIRNTISKGKWIVLKILDPRGRNWSDEAFTINDSLVRTNNTGTILFRYKDYLKPLIVKPVNSDYVIPRQFGNFQDLIAQSKANVVACDPRIVELNAERAAIVFVDTKEAKKEGKKSKEKEELAQKEKERLAKEKAEAERAELARLEQERLAKEIAEAERAELARLEQERLAKEKAEAEKAELARIEKEKLAKEKAEVEKAELARLEKDRLAKKKAEEEKAELARQEQERLAKSKSEKEKAELARKEQERKAKEKAEAEKADLARLEQERMAKEKAEAEKAELARLEQERIAKEKAEAEKAELARLEQERIAKEKAEAEKAELARLEKERIEKEMLQKRQEASFPRFLAGASVTYILPLSGTPLIRQSGETNNSVDPGLSIGYGIHARYQFKLGGLGRFQVGTGFNLDNVNYQSELKDFKEAVEGAIDPDNYPYLRQVTLKNITEDIKLSYFSLPVGLEKIFNLGRSGWALSVGGDASFLFLYTSKYKSTASLSISGLYKEYNLIIDDLEVYGFGKFEASSSDKIKANSQLLCMDFGAGIAKNLGQKLSLQAKYRYRMSRNDLFDSVGRLSVNNNNSEIESLMGLNNYRMQYHYITVGLAYNF